MIAGHALHGPRDPGALFKNRPSLAAEILVEVLGLSLPDYTEARITSADLTEIQPAEYRADIVVLLLHDGAAVRVVIVEVQLAPNPKKRLSWPAYVTVARAVHGCPADLLVVAPSPAVAAWCAEPIAIGSPGFVLCPPVLDRTRLYYDLVYNSLNEAARRALEILMKGYEYQTDFAKKYVAQGRAEGRTEGRTEEAARNLLAVLRVRGIAVPDAVRERILAQKDPERLERWLEKAAVAVSAAAVLDDPN
jgi:hypothetical protein